MYVIFITEHDVLGGGLPMYTIERVIAETGKPFGDKSYIVYVNGEHRDSGTALGRLVHDIFCERPKDMYYSPLAERVDHFKADGMEVGKVSEVMDRLLKAQEKEYKERVREIAQKLLEIGKLAVSEIAESTGLSVSTVRRMAKKLEEAKAAQAAQA